MSATKIAQTTGKAAARPAAPTPTASQAAFLKQMTGGRLVCSSITAKGLRRAILQTPAGRPVRDVKPLRRTMVDSCVNKGWLAKVSGDETSTTFALSDAGRVAMRRAAKPARPVGSAEA